MLVQELWKQLQGDGIGALLARGAGGAFSISIIAAVIVFISNILIARFIGVTQYGIYIYALTWINLLALLCQLGMRTSLLRFVSAYRVNGEWGLLRGVLQTSAKYSLLASIIIGATTAVVIWFLKDNISPDQFSTFLVALFILPLISVAALRQASLRALKRVVRAEIPDSLIRPLIIMSLSTLMFVLLQGDLQAVDIMMYNLVAAFVAFTIGTLWLIRALPDEVYKSKPVYSEREWLSVSLPLFFMSGMSLLLHKTDIIMIGIYLDAEQVGVYAIASRIAGLMTFGLSAANAIVAPMISELYSTNQHQKLQRMITLAARGIAFFTLVVFIVMVLLGDFLLGLFGEAFVVAYVPLIVLLVGQAINALAGSVGYLMSMTGHQMQAAKIVGLSAVVNIVANFMLIPVFGIIGAAVATAVTTALWNFLMFYYVLRTLNINSTVLSRLK
ncbi:MAG: oligosaccharide flippase family protein [Methylococcales bacterium]